MCSACCSFSRLSSCVMLLICSFSNSMAALFAESEGKNMDKFCKLSAYVWCFNQRRSSEDPAEIRSYLSCCSCCSFSLRITAGTCPAPAAAIEGRVKLESSWYPCQLVKLIHHTDSSLLFLEKRKRHNKFLAALSPRPDCRVAAGDGNLISQGTNVPQMLEGQFALFHLETPRRRQRKWTEVES